jgi:Protein of unknown function (DUF3144)
LTNELDKAFFARADAHINLANSQIPQDGRNKVSASFMYGLARFSAWLSACQAQSGDDLQRSREEIVDYFVRQYRAMLNENLDDYVRNFDKYMRGKPGGA